MMSGFINMTMRSLQKMLKYPASLPAPLKSDRSFQMVDPLVSTPFDSGQTRWDRQFTDVPTATPVSFIFSDVQCQAFEAWYRDVLRDGAEWFEMPLRTPVGRSEEQVHFVKGYSGPERMGFDRWRISASLILRRRPIPAPGSGEFPDFILMSSIFDTAVNEYWPDHNWQTYMPVGDLAINQQWPSA